MLPLKVPDTDTLFERGTSLPSRHVIPHLSLKDQRPHRANVNAGQLEFSTLERCKLKESTEPLNEVFPFHQPLICKTPLKNLQA